MNMTKPKVCAFTGHRFQSLPFGSDESSPEARKLKTAVSDAIETLITTQNCLTFLCGMALGADQICAAEILRRKLYVPELSLHCYIPCQEQFARWSGSQTARYREILKHADEIICLQERYTPDCMHRRNRAMVDAADLVFAVWNGSRGGTASTVAYAQRSKKPVFVFNPLTYHTSWQ